MTVDKSAKIYRINHGTDSDFVTLNLRNMPTGLTDMISWALANPSSQNGNGELGKVQVDLGCITMHASWYNFHGDRWFSEDDRIQLSVDTVTGTGTVTFALRNFFDESELARHKELIDEASCWYVTFTITDDQGNITNYVTNVACFGDEDITAELRDGYVRSLSGSTLAY